jgi:hypothetical protein
MTTSTIDSVSTTLPPNVVLDLLAALKNIALLDKDREAQRIARDAIAKAENATRTPSHHDEKYERQMKIMRYVMEKRSDVLRQLAK